MSTKSTFAFKTQTSMHSTGLLENKVAVSSALLCISLSMNRELLAENKKLKLSLTSNGSSQAKNLEMKAVNEKVAKLTTRCKAFQNSAIQLAAQLEKSCQWNKILKEKAEVIQNELEKERGFRAKLSKQCRRLDQHVICLTRKNKEENFKFIPDYFGKSCNAENSIGISVATHSRKLADLTSNDENVWIKHEIENLKKQKIQADEKRLAAEEKLSQIQNDFFLQTMH